MHLHQSFLGLILRMSSVCVGGGGGVVCVWGGGGVGVGVGAERGPGFQAGSRP